MVLERKVGILSVVEWGSLIKPGTTHPLNHHGRGRLLLLLPLPGDSRIPAEGAAAVSSCGSDMPVETSAAWEIPALQALYVMMTVFFLADVTCLERIAGGFFPPH